MKSLGNEIANSIWEAGLSTNLSHKKPEPNSSQEEKERYIIAKYSQKVFLKPFLPKSSATTTLVDAILRYINNAFFSSRSKDSCNFEHCQ
jgi:hypothetical protein